MGEPCAGAALTLTQNGGQRRRRCTNPLPPMQGQAMLWSRSVNACYVLRRVMQAWYRNNNVTHVEARASIKKLPKHWLS
eukprot:15474564-Alexandrium_andersonii.AAC.1